MSIKTNHVNLFEDISDLDYLGLTKFQSLLYNIIHFFKAIPSWLINLFKQIGKIIAKFFNSIVSDIKDIGTTFVHGDFKTKISYFVMGFGSIARGQIFRGILFFLFEVIFIVYMVTTGGYWLSKYPTLGTVSSGRQYDAKLDTYVTVPGDDSFKCLFYGTITIIFIICFVYTWRTNIKQNKINEELIKNGHSLKQHLMNP